jgi:hypothetical protein
MAFNTTPIHGKKCRIEKNDVKMEYSDGWNIDVSGEMADASRQGQDWKEGLPGQYGWTGSFVASFVPGNTEQKAFIDNIIATIPGTKLTDVKFLLDADTNAFTGDIFLTGFSINTGIGDKVGYTINFQGDGELELVDTA